MAGWQFLVVVALLLWVLWRTRVAAQSPPWLRDALLRRVFEQLNGIEAKVHGIPLAEIEKATELWWKGQLAVESVRAKGWPLPWAVRPTCGPWCHSDWNTRGSERLSEIERDVQYEKSKAEKIDFELVRNQAEEEPDNAERQYLLGAYYSVGHGVTKDEREAGRLFQRAAELGHPSACIDFAGTYFNNGNSKEAYFWLKLSAAYGGQSPWLNELDEMASRLNADDRLEVEARCRKWLEDHPAKPQ
jgi:hypothetical protein